MTIRPTAEVVGIQQRSSGVTVTVRVQSHADAVLINEQYFVSFVPRAQVTQGRGAGAPPHDLSAEDCAAPPVAQFAYPMSPDQTRRYADASHDHDAYTLDEQAARAMGFPAILVHGMCTFAFSARAVVAALCRESPERLTRLAVRLSRPVYLLPGQQIDTTIWRRRSAPLGSAGEAFGFVARDREGAVVLSNGLAEVKPC
jgi:acyl dehydratase